MYQFDFPSPAIIAIKRTAISKVPTSPLLKFNNIGSGPTKKLNNTKTGAIKRAILMELPKAMLMVRSTLFFVAMAIAEMLSAAPPITATNTIPINLSSIIKKQLIDWFLEFQILLMVF